MCRSHLFLHHSNELFINNIPDCFQQISMDCVVQIMTMNAFIFTYAHIKFFLFVDEKLGKKKKGKIYSYLLSASGKYTTFCRRSNER